MVCKRKDPLTQCALEKKFLLCLTYTTGNRFGYYSFVQEPNYDYIPRSGTAYRYGVNIKWKLKTIISNEDSSFAEPVDFLIVDKITEFTPSSNLDISNVEIPKFLTLADKSFYEANEVHALISADIFFKVLKQNTYKVNEELFFKESEFGWIACGKLEEKQINIQGQCFLVNNDSIQDTLKLYFDLEGLGIRDDPVLHERDQSIEILKETVEFEKGRYIVQLPFRKSYNELSDYYPLAKQRFQNLWRRFGHDWELYQQYREIIRDYTEQGIIEEVKTEITDNKLKRPVYYLPHQAIRKDGRLTSKTRIVFDAGSHQNNELSLNDCLWPGINLNPNLLDILINFRLNAIAFCSDIKQAFLQVCLADEHKDAVRFLWSDDEPCVNKRPKLQVYRFNRVNFGVSSSPFLLAATIRHHIEKYKHEFPDTVELLDRNFYVDDLISGGNEFEEALQTSRRAKNIMEAAGMDLRKWITNDANLMEQWKKENFNVHPVHETVSLGANGTKVLGLSWNTNEDYLTTETKSLLEFVSLVKNTKRFILQAVGKIFDPLGRNYPFTVRMKCLPFKISGKKKFNGTTLCQHILKRNSTLLEDNVELHSFCDASKKAYGAAIYLRTKSRNGISVKLVTSKSRVAPLNCVTLPRLELLGALVAARQASKVEGILNSRPLTPLSSDADNFDVLTPGHFLIGRPITSIPEPNLIDVNENRLSRWEKITKVVQRTWQKWKSDYLNILQARSKWITEKNDLMIGQMVLIKEDFLPITTWPLGRILEVYHGSDGKVRVVKVKTQSGEFKRAISKIAVLPIDTK
ncbi:uncharacterized protein TNCV_1948541 [Trichonephila clavipes]|nr:uncharacterized protein TNCV_1948541 [Trichonephila clavipes]